MSTGKGLGRGLSALFGEEAVEGVGVGKIRIADIEPNPNQPRRVFDEDALNELAESIRQNGVISPITLRKTGSTYQIIAGERRWRASRLAGITEIPAVVLDIDDKTAYRMALIENLQRKDLNPIEEAEGYQTLIAQYGLTQDQAAEQVGKSRPAVSNSLRLLGLPSIVKAMVSDGTLSAGHARALAVLESEADVCSAAKQIIEENLTVRDAERLVKKIIEGDKSKPISKKNIYIRELEQQLASSIGHKISIKHGAKKGKLTIEYYGNEDLDFICEALKQIKNENGGKK